MPHDFHPIKCGYVNCLCISGTSLSHAMAVHASEYTCLHNAQATWTDAHLECTMHKPHGGMCTLSSQCTHSELTAPSRCIKWPKSTRSTDKAISLKNLLCHTGAECSTEDAGRVSALQGCMHMGNSYIQ